MDAFLWFQDGNMFISTANLNTFNILNLRLVFS